MELQDIWNEINSRVDWLKAGIWIFALGSLLAGGYAGHLYTQEEDVLAKHGLTGLRDLEVDEDVLDDLPDLDEIEVDPPPEAEELPTRFAELKGTDLFLPLTARRIPDEIAGELEPEDPDDPDAPEEAEPRLPEITGFEIAGRIIGDDEDVKIGLLKRSEDNRIFVAREGEYLEGTEIRVEDISDTVIRLGKPEHRETEFQFDTDRMSQQIREQILQH